MLLFLSDLSTLVIASFIGLGGLLLIQMGGCTTAEAPPVRQDASTPEQVTNEEKPIPFRESLQTPSRRLEIEQLQALGYVDATYDRDSELRGVLEHDRERAQYGYNFYSSWKAQGARLVDMEGRLIHEWKVEHKGGWNHAQLLPNGDVLVIVEDQRLSRYDKSSKRIWNVDGRFHHDLCVYGDEIYVLARKGKKVDYIHPKWPIVADVVQVRTLDGELQREISVHELLRGSPYEFLLPSISHQKGFRRGSELDILHTNHVEVFDGRHSDKSPLYARGNLLLSMRNINSIAIVDGKSMKIAWMWGPNKITYQHHPVLLDNAHILLFDNGLRRSRVIEIDPLTNQVVWTYAPQKGFFSQRRGSAQRLANGNTLITESDKGYVLEVTPAGKVVWKFANPSVNEKKEREVIWRMTRVNPESLRFLER